MADEGSADTFEYMLAGRVIVFRKASRGQLMMLQRLTRGIQEQMQAAGEDSELMRTLFVQLNDLVFEAAESLFLDPADLTYVQTQVLRGKVDEEDIYAILSNGQRPPVTHDDADAAPAKKARKAAPVKKAAAKRAPASRRGSR